MKNKYFPDEEIEMNDLYFVCYMIERVARHIKQKISMLSIQLDEMAYIICLVVQMCYIVKIR